MVIMTEFEKLIVETPITMDCFEMDNFEGFYENKYLPYSFFQDYWEEVVKQLERLRHIYNESKDEKYLKELMRLLPNTYRVRKDNVQYEFGEVKHRFIL